MPAWNTAKDKKHTQLRSLAPHFEVGDFCCLRGSKCRCGKTIQGRFHSLEGQPALAKNTENSCGFVYLLRPLQFFHQTCTINPNTWVERDRYEEEKKCESDHGPYHRGHRHCRGERGTDDKDSMGERLGILYVIRQKQYRLILPPVCDKMGKKRKRVEENAVRTNAGNAEKLLGHPENVY